MRSHLPASSRARWYLATSFGSLLYWLIFWALWYRVFGAFDFFRQPLIDADGNIWGTLAARALAGGVGAMISLASTLPMAGTQWLVMRRHVKEATRWLAIVVMGSALVTDSIIAVYFWAFRYGLN